ncbi:MAG: phosphatase PAP2 family protein [Alistipes sp.]|nr:phosphatase PAP2 family protein [Alistipes sp.]
MRRTVLSVAAATAAVFTASAQSDTLLCRTRSGFAGITRESHRTTLVRTTCTAVPLIAAGAALRTCDVEFNGMCRAWAPSFSNRTDDWLQYAPAALMVGMKTCVYQSRSSWGRMLVSDAISAAIMAAAVNACKYSVRTMRPDGSARNSFPSGHTATAFMTATMLRREYGCRSPWFGVGGYAAATTVAVMRQLNNRHWMSDVMVGAGIGILATELGYMFADMILRDRGLLRDEETWSFDRFRRPLFFGVELALACIPGHYDVGGRRISFAQGASAALQGAWFFSPYAGIGGRFAVSRAGVRLDGSESGHTLESLSASGGLCLSYPLSRRIAAGSRIAAGWEHRLACRIDPGTTIGRSGAVIGAGLSLSCVAADNFGFRLGLDYDFAPAVVSGGQHLHRLTLGLGMSAMF